MHVWSDAARALYGVWGALVSAIPSHVRTAPQSPVTRAYAQLTARLGWRVARVAAARKLLHIVYIMLRRREPWRGAGRVEADVRDEVRLTCRSTTSMRLIDPSRSYSQIMRRC